MPYAFSYHTSCLLDTVIVLCLRMQLLTREIPPEQTVEMLANITSMEEIQADVVSLAVDIIENLTADAIKNEKV